MDKIILAPFRVVKCPSCKLRAPSIPQLSPMTVYALSLVSCFLFFGGIVYDVIQEPPSIGQTTDARGNPRPQTVLPYRINGQYIIEGLSASGFFIMGVLGLILVDNSQRPTAGKYRWGMAFAGCALVFFAYNMCMVFLRMKVPGYLHR